MTYLILTVLGFVFGIIFTRSHFWALKRFVFTKSHFKRSLTILSLIRLCICFIVLWIVIKVYKELPYILVFFISFMLGRFLIIQMAKKRLKSGKSL